MKATFMRIVTLTFVGLTAIAVPAMAESFSALSGPGTPGDAQTSLVYNPSTGQLSVDPPTGGALTSINIDSAGGRIQIANVDRTQFAGSFDNVSASNLFKATFGSSFGAVSFGNALPSGLSRDAVIADLTSVGSLQGGGGLGNVDLVYVPEPSTMAMLGFGLVGLLAAAWRRR